MSDMKYIYIHRPYETFGMVDQTLKFDNSESGIEEALAYALGLSACCRDSLDFDLDNELLCYGIDNDEMNRLMDDVQYLRDVLTADLELPELQAMAGASDYAMSQIYEDSQFSMVIYGPREALEKLRAGLR